MLKPKMLPSRIDIAPTEVLKIIKCNCSGNIGSYLSFENGRLGDTTWSIPLTRNVIKVYSFISASHYRTNACSCTKSGIPCTVFCGCECTDCQNPHNLSRREEEEEEDDNEDNNVVFDDEL